MPKVLLYTTAKIVWLGIVVENKEKLLKQWQVFKNGGNVRIIKINK
jgi:hypothetical protein